MIVLLFGWGQMKFKRAEQDLAAPSAAPAGHLWSKNDSFTIWLRTNEI
jgi:hypothetical protein